jgi:hypothetical protein
MKMNCCFLIVIEIDIEKPFALLRWYAKKSKQGCPYAAHAGIAHRANQNQLKSDCNLPFMPAQALRAENNGYSLPCCRPVKA